jgi:hypothetical protein
VLFQDAGSYLGVRLGEGGKEETSNRLVNSDDEFVKCRADGSALHWKYGGAEI